MARKPNEEVFLYTFYIALFDVDPLVWRRFSVPSNITFAEFHEAIQIVMGWENYHLYSFKYGPIEIGTVDDEEALFGLDVEDMDDEDMDTEDMDTEDATKVQLSSLQLQYDDLMTYIYDFGDNWVHMLRLETISEMDKSRSHAYRCEAGARACPPEDVGGPLGYDMHVKALADESDPGHADALNWSGPFDAEAFDVNAVNEHLAERFGGRKGKR